MISQRAALAAVLVAFFTGLVGSLALRPAGSGPAGQSQIQSNHDAAPEQRIHWRMPISITSTAPILGEAPLWLAQMLSDSTGGAIKIDVYNPGELVPAFSITDAVRDGMTNVKLDGRKVSIRAATPYVEKRPGGGRGGSHQRGGRQGRPGGRRN